MTYGTGNTTRYDVAAPASPRDISM